MRKNFYLHKNIIYKIFNFKFWVKDSKNEENKRYLPFLLKIKFSTNKILINFSTTFILRPENKQILLF